MTEQMTNGVRVRYAPSPTGLQHIGGLRTALFNYLFARAAGGTFILRLEDTDRTRYDERYVHHLYETFRWLGFHWDEGPDTGGPCAPYIQSERTALYRGYAQELVRQGRAYYCFCPAQRLEALRKEREAAHSSQSGYDRLCRALPADEAARRAAAGEPCVIRLKIPEGGETQFDDKLLGRIIWKNADINPDPVLLKSDSFPTYHLANVVDDHLMRITHVLRAQEWLASTPLHVILYGALGWEPPVFCHLPMVMGQDGKKLSKRHGATAVDEFRKAGVLPQALINYVAQLGASYEEGRELFTPAELAARFSLGALNKAPAVFDYKKLGWFNAQYIKAADVEAELAPEALFFARQENLFGADGAAPDEAQALLWRRALPLVTERVNYLSEIPAKLRYLFTRPAAAKPEDFIPAKAARADACRFLRAGRALIERLAVLDAPQAEALAKEAAEREHIKLGDLLKPLRVAVTGAAVSPPLFGSVALLGAGECLARIDEALAALEN